MGGQRAGGAREVDVPMSVFCFLELPLAELATPLCTGLARMRVDRATHLASELLLHVDELEDERVHARKHPAWSVSQQAAHPTHRLRKSVKPVRYRLRCA